MSRRPSGSSAANALAKAFLSHLSDPADPAAREFIVQAAEDASADELTKISVEDLGANLADFWAFGARRRGRKPMMRLVPMLGEAGQALDRLEIIQDDAPFLVDSVMGEVTAQGFPVQAMFHPLLNVARNRAGDRVEGLAPRRESMIQVILEHVGADRAKALLDGVTAALDDVAAAVADFPAMLALMDATMAQLRLRARPGPDLDEDLAFLTWLRGEHFVFLGARAYTYPRLPNGDYAPEEPAFAPGEGLGVLRDPDRRVLRRANEPAVVTAQVSRRLTADTPVVVAKANLRSRVHRRGYMDYVGVKLYGDDGRPSGEVRFVGLFTAEAYDEPTAVVPLIRAKVAKVLALAGKTPGSHNEKRLRNIVENHPRDELFQMGEDELLTQALAILHLFDRPRVRLFERRDPFDRFASVLLYIPRDRYDSELQAKAGALLAQAYDGRVSAAYPHFSDAPLARIHFIIGFTPGLHARPDLRAVEAEIAELARTWSDRFVAALRGSGSTDAAVAETSAIYAQAFPAGYRDRYDAAEALADVAVIQDLAPDEPIRVRAFRRPGDVATQFRFKLYRPGAPAPLAEVLPILEHMGLKALVEEGFPIRPSGVSPIWVHEFELVDERGEHLIFTEVKEAFEDAFVAIWTGRTESDGFNRLVLELSISWREAALIRAMARYRQQSGLDPTQRVQEEALSAHPAVARLILDMFRTKFHPAVYADLAGRKVQAQAVMGEILEALQQVESLDDDRVLRRLALLTEAVTRTNFYQLGPDGGPKPHISFKVESRDLADLPAPKPFREIFVWAPHVEGVHLRFGPVARGGLRWSDRRDDFRTEVLGLVKAQQTKNAVIVPVGSKGGFYPKHLPKGGAPDAIRAEGIRAYVTFLHGLLDITDNLTPDGAVVHPERVIVHDGDDPYLVVAADKGTATFSDIANGVAQSYGFWLDDAFASGGSAGYDHKVMGITARGAWEAVKRHFREMGKDIQAEPFTVVGVGDMSGDVFGNGMLLSRQTLLLAAFDHRHIFIDPTPDPARAYAERERMFALPRSSWDDYDRGAISPGGGVFPRALKSIPLTAEIRQLLDISAEAVTPAELITSILKARAELLYLGGIGTYVKARGEGHAAAGDKANDAVRVNGADLRVKVVGEGANLGLTQAGRIEFALAGGRVETDAIDNSAGVDSSDHEVNIKILTGALERTGTLTRKARDKLLRSMVSEVAEHVLAHNYSQTLALSLLELDSPGELEPHARFMSQLEAEGRLDRAVEGLPDATVIAERAHAGQGLTRPELAVLLAYGKIELSRDIVECAAADDPWLERVVVEYFPKPLRKYREAIERHRLRREIIATVVANDVVNRCGPSFPSRLMAAAACDARAFVAAYEAAKVILDLPALWSATAALDGMIPAAGQMSVFRRLSANLRALTFWLARRAARDGSDAGALIARYGGASRILKPLIPAALSPLEARGVETVAQGLTEAGAPQALSQSVAALQPLTTAADLVDLAEASSWKLDAVARLYHQTGAAFAFDRLRAAVGGYRAGDYFERTAVRRMIEDLLAEQAMLTRAIMDFAGSEQAAADPSSAYAAVASWAALRREPVQAARRTLDEIEGAGGEWSFAKLTIAHAALRELAMLPAKGRKRG